MAEAKKVKVCKKCSGFDVNELTGKVPKSQLSTGCIGRCVNKNPDLGGKAYGFLNGEFVVCDTKEEFLAKVDEAL